MPLNPKYYVPQEMKTSIIKIFTYVDNNPTGVLINPYFDNIMYFESLIQFLMLMDEMQDSLNYPQESMENRTFNKESQFRYTPGDTPTQEELGKIQPIASFKISVYFRQNTSWQGSIAWLERAEELQFRSVFELIKIIDSVLQTC
ncbi:MAG: hypothetical protein GX254_04620 [Clostridiales bacterium]|jgi:hypothetical protein|nr:hypothetical protein [Clostridiales bacterium]